MTTLKPAPSTFTFSGKRLPKATSAAVLAGSAALGALFFWGLGFSLVGSLLLAYLAGAFVLVAATWSIEGKRKGLDRLATLTVVSAFSLVLIPLVSIVLIVIERGLPALSTEFFTYSMRNVVGEGGGIYHAIVGTLLMTLGAALISIPIGLLTAIYLVEYGQNRRLARIINFLVDVMTGIPSIVAGLFAYAVFALIFGPGIRMGFGGSVALSVLMIPVVVRGSEEMLKLVPNELREASYALGITKWRTIIFVVIPTSLAGLVTTITLAIARVIGETAPLLVIAGATASVNFNLFNDRMASLPVFAYSQTMSPGAFPEASIERAWGAALVLILIVLILNLFARSVSFFVRRK